MLPKNLQAWLAEPYKFRSLVIGKGDLWHVVTYEMGSQRSVAGGTDLETAIETLAAGLPPVEEPTHVAEPVTKDEEE